MPLFAVAVDTKRWVAIVNASDPVEALAMAATAMWTPEDGDGAELWCTDQTNNQDARQRLGERELIGWTFQREHETPKE